MLKKDMDNRLFHQFIHEVKNPLTICNGYLQMIPNSSKVVKEKYYEIIKKEMNKTLTIIRDYSINNNKLNIETIECNELLEEIITCLNSLFKNHHSKIIFLKTNKTYILGDKLKLKQVLINILKNSFESKTKDNLLVVIKLKVFNNKIDIIITDNGIGMSKKELSNCIKDNYTTKENGSGVGLPFCKDIIILHQGVFKIKSRKNIGTRITITLPKYNKKEYINSSNYCWNK